MRCIPFHCICIGKTLLEVAVWRSDLPSLVLFYDVLAANGHFQLDRWAEAAGLTDNFFSVLQLL